MSYPRLSILVLGPFAVVTACYWMTYSQANDAGPNHSRPEITTSYGIADTKSKLTMACEKTAAELLPLLSADCNVLIHPPYVLGGNISQSEIQTHLRETIGPTALALSATYFDHQPDIPITILMFTDDDSYQKHAERLDGRQRADYYGYYQKAKRRIVLNIATGNGTLAHELTHALAQFDFPNMPEWFDEGLASLHEESEFSDDRLRILGLSNWRIYFLIDAIQRDNLRSLESLLSPAGIRDDHQAIDYAHSRYLCLYLQQQGLLAPYYRRFRDSADTDLDGSDSLRDILNESSLEQIDADFRRWATDAYRDLRGK